MSAAPFDTLKYAEALKTAGVPDVQAKAQAEALADALRQGGSDLVTKTDLKTGLVELEARITTKLYQALLVQTFALAGLVAAIVKLL